MINLRVVQAGPDEPAAFNRAAFKAGERPAVRLVSNVVEDHDNQRHLESRGGPQRLHGKLVTTVTNQCDNLVVWRAKPGANGRTEPPAKAAAGGDQVPSAPTRLVESDVVPDRPVRRSAFGDHDRVRCNRAVDFRRQPLRRDRRRVPNSLQYLLPLRLALFF